MAPKFGTSGLRGLVVELTSACVADYISAFIAACPMGTGLYVGHDYRPSSPDLAKEVAHAAQQAGLQVVYCGPVPTPALALAAGQAGAGAVMVTGSHIPADRNGLKFYTPAGEITKADEQAILAALGTEHRAQGPEIIYAEGIAEAYVARYVSAFGQSLSGMHIGVYAHSSVARDVLVQVCEGLGATTVTLGFSDSFVPVDTEAVAPEVREQLKAWAAEHDVAAIVSADPDADRPLLTDGAGNVIPGDVLGQITAKVLGAEVVVTPVSSNSGVDLSGAFRTVSRTKIGSPFVIAAMEAASGAVVGYEANGGFLLGYEGKGPAGPLAPLVTRDSVLPMVCVLTAAHDSSVAHVVAQQPPRFTAADRLQEVPTAQSQALVRSLIADASQRAAFLARFDGTLQTTDETDGLRMTLQDGRVLHLRPSGNAPELRLYVEASCPQSAEDTLLSGLKILKEAVAAA